MPSGLPSASAIVTTLKGISLPSSKDEVVDFARMHGANDDVLLVLEHLPESQYESASDIAQGISRASRHIKELVPSVSASEVARTIKGVDFPASKQALIDQARQNGANDAIVRVFEAMDRSEFHNVVEIGRGIREAKDNIRRQSHRIAQEEVEPNGGQEEQQPQAAGVTGDQGGGETGQREERRDERRPQGGGRRGR